MKNFPSGSSCANPPRREGVLWLQLVTVAATLLFRSLSASAGIDAIQLPANAGTGSVQELAAAGLPSSAASSNKTPSGPELLALISELQTRNGADDISLVVPLLAVGQLDLHQRLGAGILLGPYSLEDFHGKLRTPDKYELQFKGPGTLSKKADEAVEKAAKIAYRHCSTHYELCVQALLQHADRLWLERLYHAAREYYLRASVVVDQSLEKSSATSRALATPVRLLYFVQPEELDGHNLDASTAEPRVITLRFSVLASGRVTSVRVIDDGGASRLARDIRTSYKYSIFRPAFVDGKPVVTRDIIYQHRVLQRRK